MVHDKESRLMFRVIIKTFLMLTFPIWIVLGAIVLLFHDGWQAVSEMIDEGLDFVGWKK